MAVTQARAEILKEADDQYTLIVKKRIDTGDEVIDSATTTNIGTGAHAANAAAAFDLMRNAFAAMRTGSDKFHSFTCETIIKP